MKPSSHTQTYYYGLDFLRVSLMLVGIFIHAKEFIGFMPSKYENIMYKSDFAEYFFTFFQLFRMEVFMALSGFFASLILMRKSKNVFFESRVRRVLVPFIATYLLLIIVPAMINKVPIARIFNLEHLWFLFVLFLYALIERTSAFDKLSRYLNRGVFQLLVFIGFFFIINNALIYCSTKLHEGIFSLLIKHMLILPLTYFPFYTFGKLIYEKNEMLNRLIQTKYIILLLCWMVAVSLSLYLFHLKYALHQITFFTQLLKTTSDYSVAFLSMILLFKIFLNNFNIKNNIIGYLVSSALIIYLFHYPILQYLGQYLNKPGLSVLTYYLGIVTLTFAISIVIFEVISRFSLLRKLFGMKS